MTIHQFNPHDIPGPLKKALSDLHLQLQIHHQPKDVSKVEEPPKINICPPDIIPVPPPLCQSTFQNPNMPVHIRATPARDESLDYSISSMSRSLDNFNTTNDDSSFCMPTYSSSLRSSTTHAAKRKSKKLASKISLSEDLRRHILTGKDNLRVTPGLKRSPGGTPARRRQPLHLSNPSDLMAYALQKKFKNVRRLYSSPSQNDEEGENKEESFNISID